MKELETAITEAIATHLTGLEYASSKPDETKKLTRVIAGWPEFDFNNVNSYPAVGILHGEIEIDGLNGGGRLGEYRKINESDEVVVYQLYKESFVELNVNIHVFAREGECDRVFKAIREKLKGEFSEVEKISTGVSGGALKLTMANYYDLPVTCVLIEVANVTSDVLAFGGERRKIYTLRCFANEVRAVEGEMPEVAYYPEAQTSK